MSELIHWITVAGCFGLVAFGLVGFVRGFSLRTSTARPARATAGTPENPLVEPC